MYGFTFAGKTNGDWEETLDYLKQESVYGDTGETAVDEYQENDEYDSEGRLVHYESTGIFEDYDEKERYTILRMDYEYGENANLKYRFYFHNARIFGTWYTTWESYFDNQGRIAYECIYITHGSMEKFYIYSDDDEKPEYLLMLDRGWGLEFIEY